MYIRKFPRNYGGGGFPDVQRLARRGDKALGTRLRLAFGPSSERSPFRLVKRTDLRTVLLCPILIDILNSYVVYTSTNTKLISKILV